MKDNNAKSKKESPNKELEDYLEKYIKDKKSDYAVLIDSNWGSGKTYFIKEQIPKWKVEKVDKGQYIQLQPIYISLNGLRDISQINTKIKEILNPLFYSKGAKFAKQLIKEFLKATLKIDINSFTSLEVDIDPLTLFKNHSIVISN